MFDGCHQGSSLSVTDGNPLGRVCRMRRPDRDCEPKCGRHRRCCVHGIASPRVPGSGWSETVAPERVPTVRCGLTTAWLAMIGSRTCFATSTRTSLPTSPTPLRSTFPTTQPGNPWTLHRLRRGFNAGEARRKFGAGGAQDDEPRRLRLPAERGVAHRRFEAAEHLGLLGRTSCNESRAVAEPGDGTGQDGIEPDGAGGDAQGAGRAGGVGGVPGGVELAQDAPCGLGAPSGVGRTPVVVRSKSAASNSRSRRAMQRLTPGWVMSRRSAAAPTPPVSTTARNRTRSLRFSNLARCRCLVAPGRSLLETTPGAVREAMESCPMRHEPERRA